MTKREFKCENDQLKDELIRMAEASGYNDDSIYALTKACEVERWIDDLDEKWLVAIHDMVFGADSEDEKVEKMIQDRRNGPPRPSVTCELQQDRVMKVVPDSELVFTADRCSFLNDILSKFSKNREWNGFFVRRIETSGGDYPLWRVTLAWVGDSDDS